MPCHRQGEREPASNRACIPHLHLKYPIENLERPLSEGIIAGHPTMPQFRLDPDQRDVIAYLKSLEQ
jgi:cytochrome c